MNIKLGRCRLTILLKERKKTARWLAERTGMSEQRISDYSNNRKSMSLVTAKSISLALDCQIDDLYSWE
ncbi:hypothetical protein BEH_07670 [Priestia filamentosa]|uniref:HTH cro/C1-type domain-containing protein n=1 Tax=Priestia filamentosa TaxID=1402861 RepID=A0A0H4KUL7_9BACI|nr:helix-turn-helix transcriptional regulator [Priestia filamentosa]AKO91988.1 hypothetical protein BEH_07670 [Priestia filamentosa]